MNQIDLKIGKEMIIDWINSLPIRSCLTINNIEELYSGEIIIDILEYILQLIDIKNQNKMKTKFDNNIDISKLFTKINNLINFNQDESILIDYLLQIKCLYDNISQNPNNNEKFKNSIDKIFFPNYLKDNLMHDNILEDNIKIKFNNKYLRKLIFDENQELSLMRGLKIDKDINYEESNIKIFSFLKPTSQIISSEYYLNEMLNYKMKNILEDNIKKHILSINSVQTKFFIFNQIQNVINWINRIEITKKRINISIINCITKSCSFIINLISYIKNKRKGKNIVIPGIIYDKINKSIIESNFNLILKYLNSNFPYLIQQNLEFSKNIDRFILIYLLFCFHNNIMYITLDNNILEILLNNIEKINSEMRNNINLNIKYNNYNLKIKNTAILRNSDNDRSFENPNILNEIQDWLKEIKIPIADKIDFNKKNLTEFKDGLLLNQILTLIDLSFKNKVIIDPNPVSFSVGLMNIKAILNYLKLNKKMPLELLSSEKEIQMGNKNIILKLLFQIKDVFWKGNMKIIKKLKLYKNINNLSYRYNELKYKENILCKANNGILSKKVCEVNGIDHSNSSFYPLNKKLRKHMLMENKYFFN